MLYIKSSKQPNTLTQMKHKNCQM
uniref:Uncharacterized protein n=1 Tax=Rhizophora mucronata TaxID=61149 RepID=A0A2P2NDF7_RHIMU